MKKVLVTGVAGFIGSHVIAELLKTDVAEILIYDNFVRGKHCYIGAIYSITKQATRYEA